TPEQLALLEQLAGQAATMLRNAQNYSQMATWAAQLQSIQQLGARLTRLRTVADIGHAICAELNQLIDYHNVRVYRVVGDDCIPVAWRGEIGEYKDEDVDQLRVKVGEGITGWVARHGLAQNLGDAANDKRSQTIPGTDDDTDESLLLAPMLYEDEVVGVIVLAKLGLNQFSGDDLRLLEIYASIAAQAMANADATEKLRAQSDALERQLISQRELLRVTESILATLDTQHLLKEIADSLGKLLHYDNICVDIHDQAASVLRPIFARGVHAAEYMAKTTRDDEGEGGYVIRTGEPILIEDERTDPRVTHFETTGPIAGSMIVAPLRSRDRIEGLLSIERLGENVRFSGDEFELVKLFAAHVAIALQNAQIHRQVELRAETDRLTGLWNHGSLVEQLDELVESGKRFGMLMVDLDFFKRYNDRYGHPAGNVMLQRIAGVLRASCRETDRVFRYGGDEFAVLLPETGLAGSRTVAEKILSAVHDIGADDPSAAGLNCSVGMAVFPRDGADGPAMILAADRACYAAKRAGRARIATANEGLALAAEFEPTAPATPELTLSERSLSVA
ncbi:MAG TPA: diguanylate cyclase, partial [Vicinamibacterales bacterium]|nr:diguanylate cyclase [Vicinamibacterales bacterium]